MCSEQHQIVLQILLQSSNIIKKTQEEKESLFCLPVLFSSTFFLPSSCLIPSFFFFLFIYLAVLGLSCDTWTLQLQHMGSSSLTRDQTHAPCTGSTVLAAGPPGKSPVSFLLIIISFLFTTSFSHSFRMTDSLSFFSFENVLISPSFLQDIITIYGILGNQFFFSALYMWCHFLLASMTSVEKSSVI